MKNVLFVCFGNCCRSPMAEGFGKVLGKDLFETYSAGVKPTGFIAKQAITAMKSYNINISKQESKNLLAVPISEIDFLINMSKCNMDEFLKDVGFKGEVIVWDVPDPYVDHSIDTEQVADRIKLFMKNFIKEKFGGK